MTAAPVRLVLDSTAVADYAGGSVAVGELIVEVADEQARVAVPLACLVEAYRRVREEQLSAVTLLVEHPAVDVVEADPGDWVALGGLARDLGSADAAGALLLALDCDGYVVTAAPDRYGDWKELPVIAV
jgi:hypothetical protein